MNEPTFSSVATFLDRPPSRGKSISATCLSFLLACWCMPVRADEAASAAGGDFTTLLFVLMLATFIGLGVITRVSRLLHTPLMSLTNAISAITVVGAILVAGGGGHGSHAPVAGETAATGTSYPTIIMLLGAIALFASMTNIVSGFLITDRMLKMFRNPNTKPIPGGK
jgi:NAD(P) transhydrogenase subunit alpha